MCTCVVLLKLVVLLNSSHELVVGRFLSVSVALANSQQRLTFFSIDLVSSINQL